MVNNLKVLYIDIETLPNIVYNWKTGYDISISPEFIIKEREIFCIGYKWKGTNVGRGNFSRSTGASERNILMKFAKLAEKADIIIGHNGDAFDIKWLRSRTMILNLKPLPIIKSIDTLKLARSNFTLNSNKLDYLADILGLGRKIHTGGMQLWKDVMGARGPKEQKRAGKHMDKYCNWDVDLLERVHDRISPHTTNLPVHTGYLLTGSKRSCTHCGSIDVYSRGVGHNKTSTYRRYSCNKCHGWTKGETIK